MREPRQDPGLREAPKTSMLTKIAESTPRPRPSGGLGPRRKPRKFRLETY